MTCERCEDYISREGYPLVFIDWMDSCENTANNNSDLTVYELPEPQRIFQCGFLVHEEEGHVVISGGVKPSLETFDYSIAIPRVSINHIRQLCFSNPDQEDG
jgi:hypothetical protein